VTSVITVEGEEALRRLNGLASFFAQSSPTHQPDGPERLVLGRASSGARTLQETVIFRCVTVVEAYFTDLARRLVNERLAGIPATNQPLSSLAGYLRNSQLVGLDQGKWEDLMMLWSGGLGVDIKHSYPDYSKLVALRTARHAITHRYGEITDQYRKQHRQRLAKEGFRDPLSAEGPVPLARSDIVDALALALGVVRWLEHTLIAT